MKPIIAIGQRVHSILYGGRNGIVYAIHGEQQPQTIGSLQGVVCFGGNATFDIVFDDGTETLQLPESILHGVQWRILPEIEDILDIEAARDHAVQESQRRYDEQQANRKAFADHVTLLRTVAAKAPEYAGLIQGEDQHSGKLAAANIRTELKKAFPGVKFSVRKLHYGSVSISWVDGPREHQVSAITDKYESGSFDGMQDLYTNHVSPWNVVFGGSKYVHCSRGISVEKLQAAAEYIAQECKLPLLTISRTSWGSGLVEGGDANVRVPYSIHLDYDSKQPTLCSDSHNGEWYQQLVHQWARHS